MDNTHNYCGETVAPDTGKKTVGKARANRKLCKQCGSDMHMCPKRQCNLDSDDTSDFDDSSIWDTASDLLSDMDTFDNDHTSGCTCGAFGRAHNRDCPMNPRSKSGNRSQSR